MKERDIFFEALEIPIIAEREAFLQRTCGNDVALRRKIDELLKEHFSEDSLLAKAAIEGGAILEVGSELSEGPGTLVGQYKILQSIGEGGMGVVYLAEQTESVSRKVALKIIKLGMDTKQVVARFEAERQALAMMDHPNIAKVFDAGVTDTGRPWFAMELVQGAPITEFCNNFKLCSEKRIELFVSVCHAIQSAHQKGIIHRDIKPSNVLISMHHGEPMPKVIDFGIAKATNLKLTEKTLFTNYGQMIGTPAYMSPEQAEMSTLDIDTRSDVYSLGVLLYELLTDTTPFPVKRLLSVGYGEMQRIIAEEEPLKPSARVSTMVGKATSVVADARGLKISALAKSLRGDVDWIAMKCLEKDRRRRYDTPNELASDLKRYLNDEPVYAAAPTFSYRFQKAWRRNKVVYLAAIAVFAALVFGITISVRQAIRATKAEDLADERTASERLARESETFERRRAEKRELESRALATRLAMDDAERALAEGRPRAALSNYATLIRWNPNDRAAVERAMSLLTRQKLLMPDDLTVPLETGMRPSNERWRDWELSQLGRYFTAIVNLGSGQGERLQVWSFNDGSLVIESPDSPGGKFGLPIFNADETLAAVFETVSASEMTKETKSILHLYRLPNGDHAWQHEVELNLRPTSDAAWTFTSLTSDGGPLLSVFRTTDGGLFRCVAISSTNGDILWTREFPWVAGFFEAAAHKKWFTIVVGNQIHLLNAENGERQYFADSSIRLPGANRPLRGLEILADGSGMILNYLGPDHIIRVVDLPSGRERFSVASKEYVASSDGIRLYSVSHSGHLTLHDVRSGIELNVREVSGGGPLRISGDGRMISFGKTVYDPWTLIRLAEPLDSSAQLNPVVFDEWRFQEILDADPKGGLRIKSWTLDSSDPRRHEAFLQHNNGMASSAPLRGGNTALVSQRANLAQQRTIMSSRFSSNSERIISASVRAHPNAKVMIFDATSAELLETQKLPTDDAISVNGRWPRIDSSEFGNSYFIGGPNPESAVRVYSRETMKVVMELPGRDFWQVVSSSDGTAVYGFNRHNRDIAVADLLSKKIFRIDMPEDSYQPMRILAKSGDYLALKIQATSENPAYFDFWSVREGRKLYSKKSDPKISISFSSTGDRFLVVENNQALLFNSQDGKLLYEPWDLPDDRVLGLRLLTGTNRAERGSEIWDFEQACFIESPHLVAHLQHPVVSLYRAPFLISSPQIWKSPNQLRVLSRWGGPSQIDSITLIHQSNPPLLPAPDWLPEAINHVISSSSNGLEELAARHGDEEYYGQWLRWQITSPETRPVSFDSPWTRQSLIQRLTLEDNVIHLLLAHELDPDNAHTASRLAHRLTLNQDKAFNPERITPYVDALLQETLKSALEDPEIARFCAEVLFVRGRLNEAMGVIEKALMTGTSSQELREIHERITRKIAGQPTAQ